MAKDTTVQVLFFSLISLALWIRLEVTYTNSVCPAPVIQIYRGWIFLAAYYTYLDWKFWNESFKSKYKRSDENCRSNGPIPKLKPGDGAASTRFENGYQNQTLSGIVIHMDSRSWIERTLLTL